MKSILSAIALLLACTGLAAQTVDVKNAWVRASVPGQLATGAFMNLTARQSLKLVAASSPVAGMTHLHRMKMEGDIMTMRALSDGLELPANRAVELKPGGDHLMMMDLHQVLLKDSQVPLTLVFKDAAGRRSTLKLSVPVALVAPTGTANNPTQPNAPLP